MAMTNIKQCIALLALSITIAAALIVPELGGIAFANYSNTVTATLNVPAICTVALSTTLVNFGSVPITGNAPTANAVGDTNDGNIASNILLDGTNWISGGSNFFVSNTIWDFTTHAGGVKGNTLGLATGNLVDTQNVIGIGQLVNLFFGTQVPSQQAAGTYTQTITIENEC